MKHITNEIVKRFEQYLYEEEKSNNTIEKYMRDVAAFLAIVGAKELKKSDILDYKQKLCEKYMPARVNSILSSLNSLFIFMGWYELKVKALKIQKKIFIDKEKELTKTECEKLLTVAKSKKTSGCITLCKLSQAPV